MANVFDVAKFILENQSPMSTWKLQNYAIIHKRGH